jgi:hypothetical protein
MEEYLTREFVSLKRNKIIGDAITGAEMNR